MRKGLTETVAFAVLTFMMIGTLSTVAMDNVIGVGELLRRETVQLQAERIEKDVYAIDSLEEAKVQIQFRGQSGYNVYSSGGDKFISYESYGESRQVQLSEPYGIDYSVIPDEGHEKVREVCLIKRDSGQIRIEAGGC